ncbi:Rit1, DUSP-like domain [Dillenia turbinata]|uniref:Rit1, DUSP-like domain n=1 Tax=Dillenia turbinata TaxID=194707 RepID=A0AAN8ZPI0_9MAGN
MEDEKLSIYKISRTIKKNENTLYNSLRSIYEDSIFVGEISQLWPELPLLANLRCGLWYSPKFDSTCYFKSTDGHQNNWSFNISRLNLHVARLAGQKGGCIIVDSTRKGKRFPDSMSKTIPIWCCVLNRAIRNYLIRLRGNKMGEEELNVCDQNAETVQHTDIDWDHSLHLPLWVPKTEKASIEDRLEQWTNELETSGADIASLAASLKKPLRPLWISQKSVIWLNEVPESDSWDFTPIILLSASSSSGVFQHRTTSEFSWNYISGAGDDEESWARGLSPILFWSHAFDIITSGPNLCNQNVANIIERDRVYRALRGQDAPQIAVKPPKLSGSNGHLSNGESKLYSEIQDVDMKLNFSNGGCGIAWLGSTNLGVGASRLATNLSNDDSILNCDSESVSVSPRNNEAYLHLPIVSSKFDRFSLLRNLHLALTFAKVNLQKGKRLFVCCHSGENISVSVLLAIFTSLFDDEGSFDNGRSFNDTHITKLEMRKRLVYICKYVTNARPSRGNLRQVFNFLGGGRVDSQLHHN